MFNGPLSGTTRVSRYQKGKTNLDFTKARDSEWQWLQLSHVQVCISLQTDNHASTPPLRSDVRTNTTNLFQVVGGECHAGKLFPDRRSEVEIERFLGPHCHSQQNAEEPKHSQVLFARQRRVEKKAVSVVADVVGGIRRRNQQRNNARFQLLQNIRHSSAVLDSSAEGPRFKSQPRRCRTGDCLWAAIPYRYVTGQLGQLSLASLRGRLIEYQLRLR